MKTDFSLIIKILTAVDQGSSLKAVLAKEMNNKPVPYKLKQRVFALSYEITRKRNFIDLAIQSLLPNTSLKSLHAFLRNLTRIFVYAKFFAPSYLPELQEFIKQNGYEKHFLIISLQNITLEDIMNRVKHDYEKQALKYYMPNFIINELKHNFNELQTYNTLNAFLKASPTYFRVNTLKAPEQDVLTQLQEQGLYAKKVNELPYLYLLDEKKSRKSLPTTPLFKQGKVIIQDKASAYAAYALNPQKHDLILDMCASPGSKTSYLASLTNGKAKILALELDNERAQLLSKRMNFLNAKNVQVINTDSRYVSRLFPLKFDKILLDPPCSAIGTLASRPDTKWRLKKSMIKQYALLQYELLEAAVNVLKPNGLLLYSTCTLTSTENQDNITRLLQNHPELQLIPPPKGFIPNATTILDKKAQYLLPYKTQSEGFFIAVLTKK